MTSFILALASILSVPAAIAHVNSGYFLCHSDDSRLTAMFEYRSDEIPFSKIHILFEDGSKDQTLEASSAVALDTLKVQTDQGATITVTPNAAGDRCLVTIAE